MRWKDCVRGSSTLLNSALVAVLAVGCLPAPNVYAQENIQELQQLKVLHKQRMAEFGPCQRTSVTALAEVVDQSRCSTFEVLENPDDPNGRKIPLKIMVVPALTADPELDPVVILAGGPGQAATDLVMLARVFYRARQQRDILLVDQRGTGELSPLQCDIDIDEDIAFSLEETLALQHETIPQCLQQMDAAPQFYTTDLAMHDLEAIRQYLGYNQFNLWGGSYGTRAALAFLRMYPDSVRSVIIDGVAPPDIALPTFIERDASAALEKVFVDCAEQSVCATAYPNLRQHYVELLDRLQQPQKIMLRDGVDNSEREVTVSRDMIVAVLRFTLYGRETQRLTPYLIEQTYAGNFQPLAGITTPAAGVNNAMMASVLCNEDIHLVNIGAVKDGDKSNYLIRSPLFTDPMMLSCELWPKRKVPDEYFDPVVSDKPVLIFSGALDPVTPPSWGEQVAKTLSNSRHFVVDGFAHNTMSSICTGNMLNTFVETADINSVKTECLEKLTRRPFFVNAGGSALVQEKAQ